MKRVACGLLFVLMFVVLLPMAGGLMALVLLRLIG